MSNSRTHAFVTPSYEGDFSRFKLLCESMDVMATGDWCHYVLTADHDYSLFKPFEGPRRKIIPDTLLLPKWLRAFRKPFKQSNRWAWLSIHPLHPVWPMAGWHIQQLRKMLIARHIEEPILVFADSDTILMRRFGPDHFLKDGMLRLYEKPAAIDHSEHYRMHVKWVAQSASILGIEPEPLPANDYIANLVTWRRDHALAMLDHIEKRSGRDLVSTMGRHRSFSEYQIYGSFVKRILEASGQPTDSHELTKTFWGVDARGEWSLEEFISELEPEHIAIGVQSFAGVSVNKLRDVYLAAVESVR